MSMIPIKQAERQQVGMLHLVDVPRGCVFQWGEDRTHLFIRTGAGAVFIGSGDHILWRHFLPTGRSGATIRKVKHLELED